MVEESTTTLQTQTFRPNPSTGGADPGSNLEVATMRTAPPLCRVTAIPRHRHRTDQVSGTLSSIRDSDTVRRLPAHNAWSLNLGGVSPHILVLPPLR